MTADMIPRARERYDFREHALDQIARTLGVSRMKVYRHLDRNL
jgi:AcrR family transcriptional regulator